MTAIILNWNLPDDTAACVSSLLASRGIKPLIHVVDNGSVDDAYARLCWQLASLPSVRISRLPTNRGFAAGCNAGIRLALDGGAEYVLVINNDTVAASDMLQRLVHVAEQHPDYGVLAPAIYYYSCPHTLWSAGAVEHSFLPFPRDLTERDLDVTDSDLVPTDYVTGCCLLIRAATLEQIGGFDERFFMYYEDNDFCRRVRARGIGIGCVKDARLLHKVGASSQSSSATQAFVRARSRMCYYASLRPLRSAIVGVAMSIGVLAALSCADLIRGNASVAWGRVRGTIGGLEDIRRDEQPRIPRFA